MISRREVDENMTEKIKTAQIFQCKGMILIRRAETSSISSRKHSRKQLINTVGTILNLTLLARGLASVT
jgi:hypothetical protein